jgi:hypothetical protein
MPHSGRTDLARHSCPGSRTVAGAVPTFAAASHGEPAPPPTRTASPHRRRPARQARTAADLHHEPAPPLTRTNPHHRRPAPRARTTADLHRKPAPCTDPPREPAPPPTCTASPHPPLTRPGKPPPLRCDSPLFLTRNCCAQFAGKSGRKRILGSRRCGPGSPASRPEMSDPAFRPTLARLRTSLTQLRSYRVIQCCKGLQSLSEVRVSEPTP